MRLVTFDFESYYAKDYTLSGSTTEQYIRDPRFEVIGFSYSIDGGEPKWVTGDFHEIKRQLGPQSNWDDVGLICHNMAFDGAILAWRFGIVPKFYFDTLSMARPVNGLTVGGSLKALVEKYLPGQAKGTEVVAALGKRRDDFTPAELAQYGEYCKNDVRLTWQLFKILAKGFPSSELRIIDQMLRMYTDPVLELDKGKLEEHLVAVKKRKEDYITSVIGADMAHENGSAILGHGIEGDSVQDFLMSNKKFAAVLERMGVVPPMKISPTTGKETYAFSKTDTAFKSLLEHPDERVQAVVAARLGVKSTLEESRTEAFIGISERGPLPILLNYYGAHTGRASGGDKVNLQNLPRGGALRDSICAPSGHVLVACDSAQIEARVVAWLAGQDDLVESFAQGKDIYSEFASKVYERPISKANKVERHVGKTCIAEGTLILTDKGEIPIQNITLEHKVWDGVEWVSHAGLVFQGEKNVITYEGLTATEDHGVFTPDGPVPFGVAASRLDSLVTTGMAGKAVRVSEDNFPAITPPEEEHLRIHAMYEVWKREMDTERQPSTWHIQRMPEMFADTVEAFNSTWAALRRYYQSMQCKLESGVQALRRAWYTVPVQVSNGIYSMGGAEFAPHGLLWRRDRQGRQQWGLRTGEYALSNTRATNSQQAQYSNGYIPRCTYATSAVQESVYPLVDVQTSCEARSYRGANTRQVCRVYDILNAGPRRRFTAGGKLVFNCILGLGYGMGRDKFQHTLKTGFISVDMDSPDCERVVNLYRNTYPEIPKLWKDGDKALRWIVNGTTGEFGRVGLLKTNADGIVLPNGMLVRYPELRFDEDGATYRSRKIRTKIYAGKVIENVVQALARIIVFDQIVTIGKRYKVVLTVHDEIVICVPEVEAEEAKAFMLGVMHTGPEWAAGLPIAAEAGIGKTYGESK